MNEKLSGLLGIILLAILVYFNTVLYKVLGFIGIDINSISTFYLNIIILVFRLILSIVVFFIFKKDLKRPRSSNNVFKMIIILLVSVTLLSIIMYLLNFIIGFIADIFNVQLIDSAFYNIFDKSIDLNLIIKIISDYILIPFLYTTTIILSIDKLVRRNDIFILISGLTSGIAYAISLNGTLSFAIINSLSTIIIFSALAFIYKRFNSIWLVVFIYSFYLLTYNIILSVLGF